MKLDLGFDFLFHIFNSSMDRFFICLLILILLSNLNYIDFYLDFIYDSVTFNHLSCFVKQKFTSS